VFDNNCAIAGVGIALPLSCSYMVNLNVNGLHSHTHLLCTNNLAHLARSSACNASASACMPDVASTHLSVLNLERRNTRYCKHSHTCKQSESETHKSSITRNQRETTITSERVQFHNFVIISCFDAVSIAHASIGRNNAKFVA
jgi:hypothetical protein